MRMIPDQLNSKNLVPFRKRRGRYKIPGLAPEDKVSMDRIDPDLNSEEQSYVRHYLGYADTFIKMTEESALAELAEADLPPNNEERPQQLPATQSRVRLVEEPGPAETNDHPARAA
jgi:hypothetical protein